MGEGRYRELTLTTRQYSYARIGDQESIVVLANNDENEAQMSVPLPVNAGRVVNLETEEQVSQDGGRVCMTVPAGGSILLLLEH